MFDVANWSDQDRKALFQNTAMELKMTDAIRV